MKEIFPAVVGNRDLCNRLAADILADTLPHALILEGPRGTGKHTVARLCAAALLCESKKNPSLPVPCGSCSACQKVLGGKSPDLILLGCDGKATIGVETVRFLREDVHVLPNDADKKIYVIEDADKMTHQAQNALLLTLEEPPAYVHFFLLCENAGSFLETIRSRAPVLRTETLRTEQVDTYLRATDSRAAQLKLSDPKQYADLLMASGGGIGRALDYLEPKAWNPVRQNRASALELIRAAIRGEGARVIAPMITRMANQKRDPLRTQLLTVSDVLRDLILLKKSDDAPLTFFADRAEAMELCDRVSLPFLYQFGAAVRNALDELGRNAGVRLCLVKMALSAEIL